MDNDLKAYKIIIDNIQEDYYSVYGTYKQFIKALEIQLINTNRQEEKEIILNKIL